MYHLGGTGAHRRSHIADEKTTLARRRQPCKGDKQSIGVNRSQLSTAEHNQVQEMLQMTGYRDILPFILYQMNTYPESFKRFDKILTHLVKLRQNIGDEQPTSDQEDMLQKCENGLRGQLYNQFAIAEQTATLMRLPAVSSAIIDAYNRGVLEHAKMSHDILNKKGDKSGDKRGDKPPINEPINHVLNQRNHERLSIAINKLVAPVKLITIATCRMRSTMRRWREMSTQCHATFFMHSGVLATT